MDIPWPKKNEQLFIAEGNYYEFSHFAWGDIGSQFYGYIEGYKNAADTIVKTALENKNIKELDTCIFPVSFLYRQYLELVMKHVFLTHSEENFDQKKKWINAVSHDLKKIWGDLVPILKKGRTPDEIEFISTVEDYIIQFHKIDTSSFAFRYPITKGFEEVHDKEKRINLKNLMLRMDELYNFFDAVEMQLDYEKQVMAEVEYYYCSE